MAGIRSKILKCGKYQGWYKDYQGKRKCFTGTASKKETLRAARRIEEEHRQARAGLCPLPNSSYAHRQRDYIEVVREYLDWGNSQGGRNGKPWSDVHAEKTEYYLNWWGKKLKLESMSDLTDILSGVEKCLRELQKTGKTGKTLTHYAGAISSFCRYCMKRRILSENPLRDLRTYDKTPTSERRAVTLDEMKRLIEAAPEERRLLYETALATGLRANELRHLAIEHLDFERGGLTLDANWTKNRKPGFQPLPKEILTALKEFSESGLPNRMYEKRYANSKRKPKLPSKPLLFVPGQPAREMEKDLEAAGIPKHTSQGKLVFHALRDSYITFCLEEGALPKETQALARHGSLHLTMDVYAHARNERLSEIASKVAKKSFRAKSVFGMCLGAC